jgi:ribosomal protein S10
MAIAEKISNETTDPRQLPQLVTQLCAALDAAQLRVDGPPPEPSTPLSFTRKGEEAFT